MDHEVDYPEFARAREMWCRLFIPAEDDFRGWKYFYTFLGLDSFAMCPNGANAGPWMVCTEATYNKIRMLSSPHAYALMKAFIIKTGYQKPLLQKQPE